MRSLFAARAFSIAINALASCRFGCYAGPGSRLGTPELNQLLARRAGATVALGVEYEIGRRPSCVFRRPPIGLLAVSQSGTQRRTQLVKPDKK